MRISNVSSCPAFPFADPKASHLVQDPLTGDWVIIAPGRRYRPEGNGAKRLPDPFSPQGLKFQKVLDRYGAGKNRITAIENSYPVFHRDRELKGRQEILVEGSVKKPFATFSAAQIANVLNAMEDRCRIFRRDPDVKFMVVFKNEGKDAGASQPHPHSQIFGLSFVPERLTHIARERRKEVKCHGMKAHALMLREATPARMVYADRSVVAFADPVSRFAYGVRILTRRPIDNLTQTTERERASLAKALHALFPLILERRLAYNMYFHDVVREKDEFFEIHFAPRFNVAGGFELDAGITVNPVPAECAAAEYRASAR